MEREQQADKKLEEQRKAKEAQQKLMQKQFYRGCVCMDVFVGWLCSCDS